MKSLFSVFAFFVLALCFTTSVALESCNTQQTVQKSTPKPAGWEKIEEFNGIVQSLKKDDAERFGICDTCVTSLKALVLENRLMGKQIIEQHIRLKNMYDSNEVELKAIKSLYVSNKKLRKDYEVRYASARDQVDNY